MKNVPFNHAHASLNIPDNQGSPVCFSRTTHLGIGAHQDDLEIMAFHGIISCYSQDDLWFGGITCTDGAGSPRSGLFTHLGEEHYRAVREMEQNEAASIGAYSFMAQLGYPSPDARKPSDALVQDLVNLLAWTRPTVVYTHNPADRHPTHLGVLKAVLTAIRLLPLEMRPVQLLGCEVWRDLDWLPEKHRVVLNVTGYENLAQRLLQVFGSQIAGGKQYDAAALGRRRAHATFLDPNRADEIEQVILAMNLSPLITKESMTLEDFMVPILEAFRAEVQGALSPTRSRQ